MELKGVWLIWDGSLVDRKRPAGKFCQGLEAKGLVQSVPSPVLRSGVFPSVVGPQTPREACASHLDLKLCLKPWELAFYAESSLCWGLLALHSCRFSRLFRWWSQCSCSASISTWLLLHSPPPLLQEWAISVIYVCVYNYMLRACWMCLGLMETRGPLIPWTWSYI